MLFYFTWVINIMWMNALQASYRCNIIEMNNDVKEPTSKKEQDDSVFCI